MQECNVCQKEAGHKCGGCQNVYYCSKEHQKHDWKAHKEHCICFKVTSDDTIGRHLLTTRELKRSEIILKESPLIWGPSQETVPVCLGCCQALETGGFIECPKCGWPVCNEHCASVDVHEPECWFTQNRGNKVSIKNFGIIHPSYRCITVLRCLYQKKYKPEIWRKLTALESHCEGLKNTQKWQEEKVSVVEFILSFFKLQNEFSKDQILNICGIVMVNAHEVPLTEPPYIAVFDKTSMFEHNCSANCNKSFTDKGEVLITSGTPIQNGHHLSICYADPLWGTPSRRYFLNETKFFWCSCARCSDPTEFGTYFSAVRCQKTFCNGFLLPKSFLSTKDDPWYCNSCGKLESLSNIQNLLDIIGDELSYLDKQDLEACKKFLKKFERFLHYNHYYLTEVKMVLNQLIEEQNGGLNNASYSDLETKIKICNELSSLFKALIPSEKRLRGIILFSLHAALAEVAGRKRKSEPDDNVAAWKILNESRKALEDSMELLKFEPEILPEGQIYKQATVNLKDLEVLLENFKK